MKAIYKYAISLALPATLVAQVGTGGAAAGAAAAGSAGAASSPSGSAASSAAVGAPRATGTVGAGAVSPSGSITVPGGAVTTPSGTPIATPGTATPIGPVNPGGISAQPPRAVGRTFDRPIIGGGPTDTVVDPAGNQPTFRFPAPSTLPPPVVTNSITSGAGAFPDPTFPPGPVRVGNTVGTNMSSVLGGTVPREPVAVNLPPGARIVTNAAGVPEAVVPPPALVNTNVGGARGIEVGREVGPIQPPRGLRIEPRGVRATPPPPPPIRGPIVNDIDR